MSGKLPTKPFGRSISAKSLNQKTTKTTKINAPFEDPFPRMSSGRKTRTELIIQLINMLKSEELSSDQVFQQVELTSLEAALKDDLGRHQWFHNLINTVITEACPVSQEELELYSSSTENGGFNPIEYEEVKEEVEHLENNIKKLTKQMSYLQEKYSQLVKMRITEKETKLITAELRVKSLIQEMRQFLDKDAVFKDTYESVSTIVAKANDYFAEISNLNPDDLLDHLALSSCSQNPENMLTYFLHHLGILFVRVHDKLDKFRRHCDNLRIYFSVNLKKDILWRSEFSSFISEMEKCPISQQSTSLSERPNSPLAGLSDTETCWTTVENIRSMNNRYIEYISKLNELTAKIKTMIDLSLNDIRYKK